MTDNPNTLDGWSRSERPPTLYRRFTFDDYAGTRAFLDRLGALSRETGCYPDISFGKAYANITLHAADGRAIAEADVAFARRVDALAAPDVGAG